MNTKDIWVEWIAQRRHGGDEAALAQTLSQLRPIRDSVLSKAAIPDGGTVIDIGCGDGLLAFGVLEKYTPGAVVFQDISRDLLDKAETTARKLGLLDRCSFLCCSAESLRTIDSGSVDTAVSRSVLMHIKDKKKVIEEVFRMLKPGGTYSFFEPVFSIVAQDGDDAFCGYMPRGVDVALSKVRERFARCMLSTDPAYGFDEKRLFDLCLQAGFRDVNVDLNIHATRKPKWSFDTFCKTALNPRFPTLEEAMDEVLDTEERRRFEDALRPLVEQGDGTHQEALCFVCARKSGSE